MRPRWGSTPRLIDWRTVSRIMTLILSERVQLSIVSWKSACVQKTRMLVWNGRQPGTQLVVSWQRVLLGRLWQEDLSEGSWRISLGRSRCQDSASRDCNKPYSRICVCQWSVNCSSEWCKQMVNKSNIQSPLSIVTHTKNVIILTSSCRMGRCEQEGPGWGEEPLPGSCKRSSSACHY
jgi:hypothetical protein